MFKDIRRKLTIFYTIFMTIFAVLLVWGVHESMKWSIASEQEREVLSFAEEEAYEHAVLFQHKDLLLEEPEEDSYPDGSGRMYFYAMNLSGEIIHSARPDADLEPAILEKIGELSDNDIVNFAIRDENGVNYRLMMASRPIVLNEEKVGTVYVGRNITAIYNGLKKATLVVGVFSVIALILTSLAGYIMAGKAIVPLKIAYDRQRQFAADASHELRTPLSVIMSSVDVLQNDAAIKSPFLQDVMADMKDEIKKMSKLVSDLLTIARSDNLDNELKNEMFCLSVVVEEVIRKILPLAEKKQVKLYFVDKNVIDISADIVKIKQLLMILLDNAIKYTAEHGIVTVRILVERDTGIVKIIVKDTGMGIAAVDQTKIFERFYRVDKARSRHSGGTGLGLSIAKDIVAAHNGKIFVTSKAGEGSEFTIELPQFSTNR